MNAYWQRMLRLHPHLRPSFNQALSMAQGMEASWIDFSVTHTQKLLDRINARIEQLDEPEVMVPIRRIGWRLHGFKIAAVAATLLILGNLWGYNYYFTGKTYTTKYGETKPLTLYDGSAVTLNANSRLELPTRYAWRRERSLFLEGEAYFQVRKQAPTAGNRKFTVKTDQVDIEVLGTHFNVLARPNHTTVLLDEGSIRLVERATRRPLLMQPGQLVEITPRQPEARLSVVNPEKVRELTGWRSNLLIFDDVGMSELALRFKEVYGLELMLQGDDFAGQEFRGELPVNDVNQALKILAETFDLAIVQEEKRVYFVKQ